MDTFKLFTFIDMLFAKKYFGFTPDENEKSRWLNIFNVQVLQQQKTKTEKWWWQNYKLDTRIQPIGFK